jgi:integrase
MADAQLYPNFDYNTLPIARPPLSGTIILKAGKTFRDAAASYVEHGGNPRYLVKLLPIMGDMLLDEIVPFEILEIAKRLYPTQKNATRNRQVIMPVRAVIYHAMQRRWSPHYRIKSFKEDAPLRKKPASPEWLHVFFRQCDRDRLFHISALVLFMSTTGARVSEALRLEWKEVDLISRTALLLKTKTGTNSIRYLTDHMVARLHGLRETAGSHTQVFRMKCRHSVNERIMAVCRRAEIEYKPSHTCGRHSMANNAMALGADIKSTMVAGDWKSIPIFLGIYVNPRNAGRVVAERFNTHQYDADL